MNPGGRKGIMSLAAEPRDRSGVSDPASQYEQLKIYHTAARGSVKALPRFHDARRRESVPKDHEVAMPCNA
jgi:hypothetical protein